MAGKDITQIHIASYSVGIVGIKQLMEEMTQTHADRSDEEIQSFMLEQLGKDNYIPISAREDYGRAFVRELRRSLGQPFTDDAPKGLDVKVLGAGCTQCHSLVQLVMEVLNELQIPAGVDHVMDFKEIARYGIMGSPALLINGKVVAVGSVPPRERIKRWLVEASASNQPMERRSKS
jgi:hypothetical protein